MADVAIRSLHAVASAPPVILPTPFPPVSTGQIELLAIWNEWIPDEGLYLPFELEVGDWLVAVVTPTLDWQDRLDFSYMSLDATGGWHITSGLTGGVNFCRVVDLWGGLPPWLHARKKTPMKVTIFVYRGAEEVGIMQTGFVWNAQRDQLSTYHQPIPYRAPGAEIARLVYAQIDPTLVPFNWNPDHGHWGDTIPAGEWLINPNLQVVLELNSRSDLSPTDETWVYGGGPWDPKFEDVGWGTATYYTIIFSTQAVDFLPEDMGNPAPVGGAHLPIRGD